MVFRDITQEELDRLLERHDKFLTFYKEKEYPPVILKNYDLSNLNLNRRNLEKIEFENCIGVNVNFNYSKLFHSRFDNCHFINSNFHCTDCGNASFSFCSLPFCNFENAKCSFADFDGSFVKTTSFTGSLLYGARFLDTGMQKEDFEGHDTRFIHY